MHIGVGIGEGAAFVVHPGLSQAVDQNIATYTRLKLVETVWLRGGIHYAMIFLTRSLTTLLAFFHDFKGNEACEGMAG